MARHEKRGIDHSNSLRLDANNTLRADASNAIIVSEEQLGWSRIG